MIEAERKHKFVRLLGARKMRLRLRSKDHDVARCTIERLMREMGDQRRHPAHEPPHHGPRRQGRRPKDLVDRQFLGQQAQRAVGSRPRLRPHLGMTVYVAFIIDVYSRMIVGWRATTSMTTPLVLDALEMALLARRRQDITDLAGLCTTPTPADQYTSIAFTERLIEAGVDASVGSVGDAYDNALAESHMGLYKSELIWPHRPWRGHEHVEIETLDRVHSFNTERFTSPSTT